MGRAEGVPTVSPHARNAMRANPRRDTAPELALRRALHRQGLRFRVDHPLPELRRRRADIVFTRARVAVFVDGCAWHGCPTHGRLAGAATNAGYWTAKIARNVERDRETDGHLEALGWSVVRVWEHEPVEAAVGRVVGALRSTALAAHPARAAMCASKRP